MLYREIMAVGSEIHTNTLCGQNVELLNVKLAVHIVTTGIVPTYLTARYPSRSHGAIPCYVTFQHAAYSLVLLRSTNSRIIFPSLTHLSSKAQGVYVCCVLIPTNWSEFPHVSSFRSRHFSCPRNTEALPSVKLPAHTLVITFVLFLHTTQIVPSKQLLTTGFWPAYWLITAPSQGWPADFLIHRVLYSSRDSSVSVVNRLWAGRCGARFLVGVRLAVGQRETGLDCIHCWA